MLCSFSVVFSHFARMSHFFGGVSFLPATTLHHPVGGFNQSEKYQSSWIIPQMGNKNKKNVSNHHPDIFSSQRNKINWHNRIRAPTFSTLLIDLTSKAWKNRFRARFGNWDDGWKFGMLVLQFPTSVVSRASCMEMVGYLGSMLV